ncbi:ABC transporter substrate-binding protein [Agromyces bauzanensis]
MKKELAGTMAVLATALLLTSCAVKTAPDAAAAAELASVPGFDLEDGTIHVGQMTALSGPVAPTAGEQVVGQQAYWDYVNAEGGIAGKYPVEVITADNQYNPQLAVQEYQKIKDQIVMLSGILGDASVEALLPILEQDGAVAVPSTQSARFAHYANLAPTFQSYQTNVWNTLSYLAGEGKLDEDSIVCGMVQADQSGQARLDAIEFGAEKLGFTVGEPAEFAPVDAAFTGQVQALKSENCDVVVFGGAANNTPNVIAAATQLDFEPTWITEFFAMSDSFRESPIAGYLQDHVLITGMAGNLDDTSIPGLAELTELIAPTKVTMQHVYGFMQGMATAAILEKAVELGDLSGPGIQEAINQIDEVDFMGLNGPVKWGPVDDRLLPDTTSIFAYDPAAQYGLRNLEVGYVAPEGRGEGF